MKEQETSVILSYRVMELELKYRCKNEENDICFAPN